MVPDKFNMVDMEGIDIILNQGVEISGLYQKLLESITPCRYQCLYNWKSDGINIPPSFIELVVDPLNGNILINTGIYVTPEDVIMSDVIADVIPRYLQHTSFINSEKQRSITLNVGNDVKYVFITSDCPDEVTEQTVIAALIVINSDGTFYGQSSRILTKRANGLYDYWQPTSTNHSWTYLNGVINITWTSDYYVAAETTYDVFINK